MKNKLIDHTLLKAEATATEIETLCAEAKLYDFASVCVNSYWVPLCKEYLQGSDVKICTVIGFPLGANAVEVKAFECAHVIQSGADEVDMVMNIGEFKAHHDEVVLQDIVGVVKAAQGRVVKVIVETCLLSDAEIVRASQLCVAAGADFVKTSTGLNRDGANEKVLRLIRDAVNGDVQIKAAGGIRSLAQFDAMIEAGADRIGTSAGTSLMKEIALKNA